MAGVTRQDDGGCRTRECWGDVMREVKFIREHLKKQHKNHVSE